jgi:ATP-dependent DNA helicase RecQ
MDTTISKAKEWAILVEYLSTGILSKPLENQYFQRLVTVLRDKSAGHWDVLTAYRDALRGSPVENPFLATEFHTVNSRNGIFNNEIANKAGLEYSEIRRRFSLKPLVSEFSLEGIEKVYQLESRRHIPRLPMDIVLAKKFNPDNETADILSYYRGEGQQAAVRTALQSKPGSTIVVNLPTGAGKTLVAHSLCLFSPIEKLTLVIVPTVALAIEQAQRAKQMLHEAGEVTHDCYFFGGNQTPQQRQDIKDRVRSAQQRILFTSPESARGALLPCLFDAAQGQSLANIVVDEAHMVDQWGDEFRPDFQIFAAVTKSLVKESNLKAKVLLLSATFTDANIEILRNLFNYEGQDFIEVHSSFLRPEPQYQVKEIHSGENYFSVIEQALLELPRPLIIYTLEKKKAEAVLSFARELGFNRIECFTGETSSEKRAEVISRWNADEIDIMVATSAFGVGMDKENVRSILHVQPPENIDRFYQEVGRSGRDGKASQSLVVFQRKDFEIAKEINKSTLIKEKGLVRWRSLFSNRNRNSTKSVINLTNMHEGVERHSAKNEYWNWRTLLLMQRAGLIRIVFVRPRNPPEWNDSLEINGFSHKEVEFYQEYYKHIQIELLVDGHQDERVWQLKVEPQREKELNNRRTGFDNLSRWLLNSSDISLCDLLYRQYTIRGITPQKICGGCPKCRNDARINDYFPTLNFSPFVLRPSSKMEEPCFLFYSVENSNIRELLRSWSNWIQSLIEKDRLLNICTTREIAKRLSKTLPRGMNKFWAHDLLNAKKKVNISVPTLIIIPPGIDYVPAINSDDIPYILLAPKNIPSAHFKRLWWQDHHSSSSVDHYMSIEN